MADFAPAIKAMQTTLDQPAGDRNAWVEGVIHPWNSKAAGMGQPHEANVFGSMLVPTPGPRGRGKSEWLTKR